MSITIKDIVKEYLFINEYDGFICEQCDGCTIDNLFCDNIDTDECEPAKIVYCDECINNKECDLDNKERGFCLLNDTDYYELISKYSDNDEDSLDDELEF